jgi:predicted 3-demethylubiquinone-9 3-methyltransferase (glyoxalase superfamily)
MKRKKRKNPADFLKDCLGNEGSVTVQRFIGSKVNWTKSQIQTSSFSLENVNLLQSNRHKDTFTKHFPIL